MGRIYRVFYSLLNLLSEEEAAKTGQYIFKKIPFRYLSCFLNTDGLATRIGDCRLKNPVILSSCYSDPEILENFMYLDIGAVTIKTITKHPKTGNPEPTVVRKHKGFVNCVGLRNPGKVESKKIINRIYPRARNTKTRVIASITGYDIDEFCELAEFLSPSCDMIELNISCVNAPETAFCYRNPYSGRDLFREVRKSTEKPVIIKLSREREHKEYNIRYLIPFAIDEGIDAVHYANTKRVKEPMLSMGCGGYSGTELFGDTMNDVRRIRKEFGDEIRIIAGGGINSPKRAKRVIDAGADAVAILTGLITEGPLLPGRINRYIKGFLDDTNEE
ncbi:MAG TPA: hypothetical protein ENG00_01000 [Candidatus Aenigmarchaeota archaeon]|nr:hypothetical protein [Candidatus Aenigmarchaeota archaeon]